jgi:heme exporter protein C
VTHPPSTRRPALDAPAYAARATGASAKPLRTGPDWLLITAIAAVIAAIVRAMAFTPIEARQGAAQKIFYVHVPAAVIALWIACYLLAITSALYLWLKDDRLDRMAESTAEVGLVFLSVVLITGPIWGKPVWGTWWSWDARLTSTLFLWFVFVGYHVLRGAVPERGMRARYSAVLGVFTALLAPFIHLTVYLFRTLHPEPVVLKPSAPSLPSEMLLTLACAFGAFLLLFIALVRARYHYATERDELAALLDAGEDA